MGVQKIRGPSEETHKIVNIGTKAPREGQQMYSDQFLSLAKS